MQVDITEVICKDGNWGKGVERVGHFRCLWTLWWTYGFRKAKIKIGLFEYKFVFYCVFMSVTLSAAQIMWRRIAVWLVNDEFNGIWKQAGLSWIVFSWSDCINRESAYKFQIATLRIACLWANIWSSVIPQMHHTQYLYRRRIGLG